MIGTLQAGLIGGILLANTFGSGYMTCAFLGGSAGSWVGARAHAAVG
ncbi:hypothetical protein [Streptomyces sp. NPDC046909]